MSKKALAIVGGIAGILGLGWLISRVKATYSVRIKSNPIRTAILVDDKEVVTPQIITLTKGKHTFKAVSRSPDLLLTYGFHKWTIKTINGMAISYEPTAEINITQPAIITAHYIMVEANAASPSPIIEI